MTLTQRYFLRLSYLGYQFRGSQIQATSEVIPTVQGTIEENLRLLLKFKEDRICRVFLSSRTDSGVHAINAGAHVNLPPIRGEFLQPDVIQTFLNRRFNKKKIHISVLDVLKVPDTFSVRLSTIRKVYVYRFGVLKNEFSNFNQKYPRPISEIDRTFFPSYKVDMVKAKEASQIFLGEKNCAFLQKKASSYAGPTICNIRLFDFKEAQPLMPDFDPISSHYNYYHVSIEGNRFLHQMVRRMVGIVLSVGGNLTSLEKAKSLIDTPSSAVWDPRIKVAPAHGLYLANIIYNSDHLATTEEYEQLGKIMS